MLWASVWRYSYLQMGKTIQIVSWKEINDKFYQIDIWKTWGMNFLNLWGLEILCLTSVVSKYSWGWTYTWERVIDIRNKEEYNTLILKYKCVYLTQLCMCVCAQLCPTLCDSMDCGLPGSSVHGLFQARILEWVAVSSSRGSSQPRAQTLISCVSFIDRWILY